MAVTEAMIEAAATALGDFESFHDEPSVYRDMAKAALEAAEKARWQPIETAPKDGTDIWLGGHSCCSAAYWKRPQNEWRHAWTVGGPLTFTPTRWQPLPSPPGEHLMKLIDPIDSVAIRGARQESIRERSSLFTPGEHMSDLETDETLQSLAEQCRLECARAEKAEGLLNEYFSADGRLVAERLLARAEKAEAERDEWKQAAEVEAGLRREFKAELDAIEAKTIERCEQAIRNRVALPFPYRDEAIAAIRALKPSEQSHG